MASEAMAAQVTSKEAFMLDVIFSAVTVLFVAVSLGYIAVCDRLMK